MEFQEVACARRSLAGELEDIVCHAIVAPLDVKIGHGKVAGKMEWHCQRR
jgi:hypothetical protein